LNDTTAYITLEHKLSVLRGYLARGWALVPLHDVGGTPGSQCSCRRACGGSAGKHPRFERWQTEGQLVRDPRVLERLHAGGPSWNWGVATGPASGIWVLDVDPDSGGERALETLRAELAAIGEALPETLTFGPTGGGGRHLVFTLPPGVEIHGSQTKNRYGLLPGLDVRGIGGQIVVHPSVSGKGAYGGMLADLPPAVAGPALTARLTRGVEVARVGQPAVSESPRMPSPILTTRPAGVANGAGAAGLTDARYRAYASAAVRALLGELAGAPVGTRNDSAYRVACRLVELANAPWSGLDVAEVWSMWYAAAEDHPDGVRVPAAELDGVWRRAVARVGEVAAEPPSGDGWYGVGGEVIPFSLTSPAVGSVNGGAGQGAGSDAAGGGDHVATAAPAAPVDPFEAEVGRQAFRIAAGEEARRRLADRRAGDPAARLAALTGALVDTQGLDLLPELRPVVAGLLYLDSCARIIGPSGHGKSFVALDLAGAIGTGAAWAGRTVMQGHVIYMAAEGVAGIRRRVRAWEIRHQHKMINVDFLPYAVQAGSPEWDTLIELCRQRRPVFIVLDTQARITVGVNENDASEMGVVVDAIERLRVATGACVTLVHHKGLNGQQGRGSTAVRAALQTELDVSKAGAYVTVATLKQKDSEEGQPDVFRLERVNVNPDPLALEDDGAVLTWQPNAAAPGAAGLSDDELTGKTGEAALVARRVFAGGIGGTKAEYRAVLMESKEHSIKISKPTFYRVWADLMERKIIGKTRGTASWIYVAPEQRENMTEPVIGDKDNKGGFYAPLD
jgi:hypothetical protein